MLPEDEERRKARKLHPLERPPQQPTPEQQEAHNQRRQVMLHIRVVRPIVTQALIAVNAIVFFIAFYVMNDFERANFYDWGANNRQMVLQFGEIHRLFTAMFLHGSAMHIVFNMYALYAIGQTVERFYGHTRFAIVYFLGGLSGSILSVLLNGNNVYSVGASGAVFAIFGAEMVFIYKHRRLLGETGKAQLRQLIIIAGINFMFGIATAFNSSGVNIDNWGHIGGFFSGLLLSWFIGPFFLLKRHPNNPEAFITEDVNPLERQMQPVLAYVSFLLILIIIGSMLARGGLGI